jgi:Xaa-Pro aminopeptidase
MKGEVEWAEKWSRIDRLLRERELDGVLLSRASNVAWLSGGGQTYINTATEGGVGSLLVTPRGRYLLTNVIEAERLREEEGFGEGGWEVVAEPWESSGQALAQLTKGLRTGSDVPQEGMTEIGEEIARLRWILTGAEVDRFRALGRDAGQAIGEAARALKPGMTEFEAAGLLAEATYRQGALPIVVLVASDERMLLRRHPLPTAKPVSRAAMLVLCARRHGLVTSATRLVHFGPVPPDLRDKMLAVATIDANTVLATRPGTAVSRIFAAIQEAYRETGFEGEWRYHHQGGLAGYEPREYVATPTSSEMVGAPQAFAWNPSVPGAKSEDTFLVTEGPPELLTPSPGWPQQSIEVGGVTLERPDILEL